MVFSLDHQKHVLESKLGTILYANNLQVSFSPSYGPHSLFTSCAQTQHANIHSRVCTALKQEVPSNIVLGCPCAFARYVSSAGNGLFLTSICVIFKIQPKWYFLQCFLCFLLLSLPYPLQQLSLFNLCISSIQHMKVLQNEYVQLLFNRCLQLIKGKELLLLMDNH